MFEKKPARIAGYWIATTAYILSCTCSWAEEGTLVLKNKDPMFQQLEFEVNATAEILKFFTRVYPTATETRLVMPKVSPTLRKGTLTVTDKGKAITRACQATLDPPTATLRWRCDPAG